MANNHHNENITSSLPHLSGKQKGSIILFGEMLADVFPDRTVLGGAPFNVARHLKAFGQNPVLITCLGDDALRHEMLRVLSQNGMDTAGIQCDKNHPTGQVQVNIENGEPRFEILPLQAYDFINPSTARETASTANPVLVYFGTLAQRNVVSAEALETLLHSTSAAKFLDINLRAPWYKEETLRSSLEQADIVKLNEGELNVLSPMFNLRGGSSHQQARELANYFEIEQVVVTCGAEGSWMTDRDGKIIEAGIRSKLASLADTVGAGDGFAAVCILGTLEGWPIATTMERANTFAASICGIRGAVPDRADFYDQFVGEWGI